MMDEAGTDELGQRAGAAAHPADRVYPEKYYEILAQDLGEENVR